MTTKRIIECDHCRSSEHIVWRFDKPFCNACKRPARKEKPRELDEDSEFCSCGKHFSECTCGETRRPRVSKKRTGPWGLPWRPTPKGYDEEQFYK